MSSLSAIFATIYEIFTTVCLVERTAPVGVLTIESRAWCSRFGPKSWVVRIDVCVGLLVIHAWMEKAVRHGQQTACMRR